MVHRADVERARRLASSSTPANRVRATPTRGSGRVVWSWSELTLCVLSARARSTRVCCRAAAPSSRIAVFRRAVAARLQAARCPLPPLAPTAAPPALAPPTASSDSLSRSRAPAHLAARVLHHARHYSRIIGAVAHLAVCGEDRLWAVSKRGGTAARPSLSGTLSLAAITHVCRMPSTNEFSFHTRHVWSWATPGAVVWHVWVSSPSGVGWATPHDTDMLGLIARPVRTVYKWSPSLTSAASVLYARVPPCVEHARDARQRTGFLHCAA